MTVSLPSCARMASRYLRVQQMESAYTLGQSWLQSVLLDHIAVLLDESTRRLRRTSAGMSSLCVRGSLTSQKMCMEAVQEVARRACNPLKWTLDILCVHACKH